MEKSQKSLIIGLVVVVLVALGAYMLLKSDAPVVEEEPDTTQEETELTEEEAEQTEEETAGDVHDTHEVVLSEQNNSGESGTALLEDQGDGTTLVTISSEGPLAGPQPQPSHIHSGTCEDLGGVEYPLENVVNGYSQTLVSISLDELLAGTYAINLHMSPEQAGIYTSCGNIEMN